MNQEQLRNGKISKAIQDLVSIQRLQQRLLTGQSFVADDTTNAVTADFFVASGLQKKKPDMDTTVGSDFVQWCLDQRQKYKGASDSSKTASEDKDHPVLLQSTVWTDGVAAAAIQMYETAKTPSASTTATATTSLSTFSLLPPKTSTAEVKHSTSAASKSDESDIIEDFSGDFSSSAHVHPAALTALHARQTRDTNEQASDDDAPAINLLNNYRPDRLFEVMDLGPWWSKLKQQKQSETKEDFQFVLVCTSALNRASTDWQELLDIVRDYSVENAGGDGMTISARAACLFLAAAVDFMKNKGKTSNSLQLHILAVFLLAAYPPLVLQCGSACSELEVKVAAKAFPALWSQTSSKSTAKSVSPVALVALASMTKAVADVYGLLDSSSSGWLSRLDPALSNELTLILGAETAASTLRTEVAANSSGFGTTEDKLSQTIRHLRLNATLLYFWTHLPGGEQEARVQARTLSSMLSSVNALEQRGMFVKVIGQRLAESKDYRDAKNLVDATASEQEGMQSHTLMTELQSLFMAVDNAEEEAQEESEGDEEEQPENEGEEGDEEETERNDDDEDEDEDE